ncbi:hypothetical protein D3C72_1468920 [compost metagenome]
MHAVHLADFVSPGKAAGRGHLVELDAEPGVADLHTGLTEVAVVEHHDGQVLRLLQRHGRQRAKAHQQFAVTGDHHHALVWLGIGQAQANGDGAAHGGPEIVVVVVIAGGHHVVRGGAQAGDDQQVAAVGEQRAHHFAAAQHVVGAYLTHFFSPIRR